MKTRTIIYCIEFAVLTGCLLLTGCESVSPVQHDNADYRFHGYCLNVLGIGEYSQSPSDGVALSQGDDVASLRYGETDCLMGMGIIKPLRGEQAVIRVVVVLIKDLVRIDHTLWSMTDDQSLQAWLLDVDLIDRQPVSELIHRFAGSLSGGPRYEKPFCPMTGSVTLQIDQEQDSPLPDTAENGPPPILAIHFDLTTRKPLTLYQAYFTAERAALEQKLRRLEDERFWATWTLNWSRVDAIDGELRLTRLARAELDRLEAGRFSGDVIIKGDLVKNSDSQYKARVSPPPVHPQVSDQ